MKATNYLGMMMAAAAITACTSDELVNAPGGSASADGNVMSFNVKNKNMTRAEVGLETEYYNFGVWAYKTPATGTAQEVMKNYLVGYHAEGKGYALDGQSTWGESDNQNDATSLWIYEGLGYGEYLNNPGTANGYYVWNKGESTTLTASTNNMSNLEKQYLKYWDHSSTQVDFYAYAPYVKGSTTPEVKVVEFNPDTKVMTIHDFSKVTMVAHGKAVKDNGDYKKDVTLTFRRLGASVGVKFWNAIPGYNIEMQNYTVSVGETTYKGAVADGIITTPSGKYTYDFTANDGAGAGSFETTPTAKDTKIAFAVPDGNIGTTQATATPSPDNNKTMVPVTIDKCTTPWTYPNRALTFHVNFKLKSVDTNETIEVKNATVVVPEDYTNWQSNTVYTYIFKITKNANGYTGGDTDPAGLYPIVFDQIQVSEGDKATQEFDISKTTVSLALPDEASVTGAGTADDPYEISAAQGFTVTVGEMTSATSTKVYVASTIEAVATVTTNLTATGDVPTMTATTTATTTVTPVKAGTTVINAWNRGVKSNGIYVKVPLTMNATATVAEEATVDLKATTNLPAASTVAPWSATWTSSAPGTATVDANGVVTGVAAGEATITLSYTDALGKTQTATCAVTVNAAS